MLLRLLTAAVCTIPTTPSDDPPSAASHTSSLQKRRIAAPAAAQTCYAGVLSTPSTNFDLQYSSKVLNTTLSYIKKPKTTYNRYCFNLTAASPCNSTALCCKNSGITRLSTVSIAIGESRFVGRIAREQGLPAACPQLQAALLIWGVVLACACVHLRMSGAGR
jgi:hypothetical protein